MIRKIFRQMLVAQILSAMTVMLCMLVDSIMIGRFLGVDSMSAYGLASPLLLVFAAFGSLISSGVQVLCSKTVGRGDQEATDACFSVSVSLAAGISAVGLVLVFALLVFFCVKLFGYTRRKILSDFRSTAYSSISNSVLSPAFWAALVAPM